MSSTSGLAERPTSEIAPGTERRELEIERALALGELTCDFAHELRNALTGVRCYLELLEEVELPDSMASFLVEVDKGLDRATNLSAQWLEFSRSRNASAYPNIAIERLVEMLSNAGVERRTSFELELDDDAGQVAIAAPDLQSALVALVADLIRRKPRSIRLVTSRAGDYCRILFTSSEGTEDSSRRLDAGALGSALGCPILTLPEPTFGYELSLPALPSDD